METAQVSGEVFLVEDRALHLGDRTRLSKDLETYSTLDF